MSYPKTQTTFFFLIPLIKTQRRSARASLTKAFKLYIPDSDMSFVSTGRPSTDRMFPSFFDNIKSGLSQQTQATKTPTTQPTKNPANRTLGLPYLHHQHRGQATLQSKDESFSAKTRSRTPPLCFPIFWTLSLEHHCWVMADRRWVLMRGMILCGL